ncbi:MAG: tyrosine-type recombinase/integrase [Candidatus Cloacimonetes bacterium]|nr:tyrosine-type recombinase/integrase [Candidatus Cloacimonadota bacterium]
MNCEIIKSSFKKKSQYKNANSYFPIEYIDKMNQQNYSEPTSKTYRYHFQRFLNHYIGIKPEDITDDQIREYMLYLVQEKHYSASIQNNAINSIKYYYNEVIHREIDCYYLPRPKKGKILPKILNELEISQILKSIKGLKNKCMIYLIYSAGLTPSELIYLKIEDIDSQKMQIFITSAKGDKDRFVVLSKKILDLLRDYFKKYRPKKWLFESYRGKQFSKRTIQKVLQNAVKESGINKPATLTILRNSFAVHLLEKGIDIRYIQKMLGHKNCKTTMKYLRVSNRDLNAVISPLDNLDI